MEKTVSIGDILSETMAVVSVSARDIAIFAAILGGVTAIGVLLGMTETTSMTLGTGFSVDAGEGLGNGLFDLLIIIVSVVASYLLARQLLTTQGLVHVEGNRFWLYLGLMILSVLGMIVGFLLLIVPGVILAVRWSASTGFLLGKGVGITESLSASWHATKGHGWAIFLAGLVLMIAIFIVVGAVSAIFFVLGSMAGGLMSAFLEAASNGVLLAFGVAIYKLVADDSAKLDEVFS